MMPRARQNRKLNGTDEDTDDAEEGVVYTTSVTAQSGTVILSADNDNDSDSDDGNNHTETADIKESNEDDGDAQNSRPSNSADDEDRRGLRQSEKLYQHGRY